MRTRTRTAAALLLAAATSPASTHAQTVEEFYKSKSITMLVGSGAGGGYDTYARIFVRHMARYVPGNPTIIAKNMPAAAGLAAASTLYTTADKDGATIAAFTNGSAMDPLFGNASARYDAQKFGWLGSIGKLQNVCATWHLSPVKSIEAARAQDVIVAAAGGTPNTPLGQRARELGGDPESRQVLELILIRQEAGRPFAAPPGVPAERLAALRRAFDATLADAEFRADAEKAQLAIEPLTARQIETFLCQVYS